MAGDPATFVRLPATLLLLAILNSVCFVISGELPSLSVAEYASLQVSPNLVVEKSPGSRPGSQVVCERVEINGLSRISNLTSFFSSVKVKVSTGHYANISVCFHRNASLGVGMCPNGQWEKLTKGSWVRSMSPFDHKLLDVRIVGFPVGTVEVELNEERYLYRVIFLVLGILLMTFASFLSNSLAVYYGGAMTLGVMLVVLVILFQGMKILPTGRKSSLGLFLYGSIVGVGSFLFSYVPTLLRSLLAEMGIGEDAYSPLAVFLLAFVGLTGAWLGFWAVRKLVLTEDGSIDSGVAHFVAWSFRILAASMILQSSVDPLLAVGALIGGVVIPLALKGFIINVHSKMSFRKNKGKRVSKPVYSPVEDSYEDKPKFHKLSDSNTFVSTFHDTTERKHYSKEEWDEFTKKSTKKALESLVRSADFNSWAVANTDKLTLRPKKDTETRKQSWLPWS
ncbi:uncharacterized protein [Rutidosis leptorrhynchoides]|uniref:uncharacterized protein isoform X2 n=1 Tax=Rutidosis leptorrhynchoides TaxID=125765 RepID=UPI003A99A899